MLARACCVIFLAVLGALGAMAPGVAAAAAPNSPVIGVAGTPDGGGFWEAASDGGVFALGDAAFAGSMGGRPLIASVVGIAPTPDGNGYREVASDGGIFTFGDAAFEGSMGGRPLVAPVVGMAATPDGRGYWEVASDGGIFTFGDAAFEGSMGGRPLVAPVVGMAATPDGRGYWEVASDGGIFTFGDAAFEGSMGGRPLSAPVVGMANTPQGTGYWEVSSDGTSSAFGGAPPLPPRISFYGDSIASEAAEDFTFMAEAAGASAYVRTFPGTAPCDWLPQLAADDAAFHPTAVVLMFDGNYFTPCMSGYTFESPQYYTKYLSDTQLAINQLHADGVHVLLVGLPLDEDPNLSANASKLNQIYSGLAATNSGVEYVDAGQSVLANGAFTWTLPCLSNEPCTGPSGTNVVRAPDGIHFCPNGNSTQVNYFTECSVYSSGAFRFAAAMIQPALKY